MQGGLVVKNAEVVVVAAEIRLHSIHRGCRGPQKALTHRGALKTLSFFI